MSIWNAGDRAATANPAVGGEAHPSARSLRRAKKQEATARARGGYWKGRFDYYGAFNKQVGYCEELAQNLLSGFKAGEMGSESLMSALHAVENDADSIDHDIRIHLLADFIVPVDRDGLVMLAASMEEATDAIEDIAIYAYIYGAQYMQPAMRPMLEHIAASVTLLREACAWLDDYDHHEDEIRLRLTDVVHRESLCDDLFIRTMHELYASEQIAGERRQVIAALYGKFEDAMDCLEEVAESMEAVISQSL